MNPQDRIDELEAHREHFNAWVRGKHIPHLCPCCGQPEMNGFTVIELPPQHHFFGWSCTHCAHIILFDADWIEHGEPWLRGTVTPPE